MVIWDFLSQFEKWMEPLFGWFLTESLRCLVCVVNPTTDSADVARLYLISIQWSQLIIYVK